VLLLAQERPSCVELAAVYHDSHRRGTHVSGRPHRRPTQSDPSLAPNRVATTPNRTPLPHPSPELWPQRMPPPGAAACSAAGQLNPQTRSK
jgi:hypothetical protein